MLSENSLSEEIQERSCRLKYFYLIDIDTLVQNIRTQMDEYKSGGEFHIFHRIFDAIYRSPDCHRYFKFLTSTRSFNYSTLQNKNFLSGCHYVFQIILRNHCIQCGFDKALKQSKTMSIRISSKTDKNRTDPLSEQYDDTLAQKYNKHKKRFQTNFDNYSYYCLRHKYCLENTFEKNWEFPVVLKHDEPLARFLFTEYFVRTFDKNIGKRPSLNYYRRLYDELGNTKNGLSGKDSFIFNCSTEYMYGFSFFHSIFKLLNYIYGDKTEHPILTRSDFKISLKDLAGETTLDLISQVAKLPMTYNRYFFLQYILYCLISAEKLENNIVSSSQYSAFGKIPDTPPPKFQLILDGLSRAGYFIQNLNYIVLPLLEDLWDVITSHFPEIDLQTYEQYIVSNADIMTFDFSSYEIQDFEEIQPFSLQESREKFYKKLRKSTSEAVNFEQLDSHSKTPAIKLLHNYLSHSRIDTSSKDTTEFIFRNKGENNSFSKSLKSEHLNVLFEFVKKLPTHE